MSNFKICTVPICRNTTISAPQKLFLWVPKEKQRRSWWRQAIEMNTHETVRWTPGQNYYVCEDHFNLSTDADNWLQYKLVGAKKIMLRKDVVPHFFWAKGHVLEPQKSRDPQSSTAVTKPPLRRPPQAKERTTSDCPGFEKRFDCSSAIAEIYCCESCSYKTHNAVNIKKHTTELHRQNFRNITAQYVSTRYVCKKCQFLTHSVLKRLRHSLRTGCTKRSVMAFECNECETEVECRSRLWIHMLVKHKTYPGEKWVTCEFKTKSGTDLKQQMVMKHTAVEDLQWFQCNKCVYRTRVKRDFCMHVRRYHV